MVSNSYNSNSFGTMPMSPVGSADANPSFTGNIPPSSDSFEGSSKKDDEKKEGKNWVPHWLATGLSIVGGIGVSLGIDSMIAKSTTIKGATAKMVASCIGGALTGLGFEWFRQENNEGKISPGSLAMNTVLSGLPFGYLLGKMKGKGSEPAPEGAAPQPGK